MLELYKLFNKEDKYEVNYVCGLFCMSESNLETLDVWKEEYLQDDEQAYWNKCINEFEMLEEWILQYNEHFINNNHY